MLVTDSAITEDVVADRGYRTITDADGLREMGFSSPQCRPGLLLPVWCTDGTNGFDVLRPDNPRVIEQKNKKLPDGTYKNKVLKYEVPKGQNMRLDCPPKCQPMLADPDIELWITEGQKKADALASGGLCAIALLGVWNWRGKNDMGGLTTLADWEHVALKGRNVHIVFDSDIMDKPEVQQSCTRLTKWLQTKDATVAPVYLPKREDRKNGVDDYLASGKTVDDLRLLVSAPRPEPQPAAPKLVMKAQRKPTMEQPLALLDGVAYVATDIPFEVTHAEGRDKRGNVVKFDPPKVVEEDRLCVISNSGELFADEIQDKTLADLSFNVVLDEPVQHSQQWSPQGVTNYCANKIRPDGAKLSFQL